MFGFALVVVLVGGLPLPTVSPSLQVTVPSIPVAVPSLPPLPLPTPLPTLAPLPVATPSVSINLNPTPTPTPAPNSSPTPLPVAGGAGSTPAPGATPAGPATHANGSGAAPLPAGASPVAAVNHSPSQMLLPGGPVGQAIAIALFVLPALLVIWLVLLARTWEAGRRWRGSTLRLAVAGELGVRPRDLIGMPPGALRSLRGQLAFDELTGVLRRPAGMAALEREIARAQRQKQPLSAVFVDVDGLKALNDSKGHAAGDALLKAAGQALKHGLRTEDLVFRFGGDEFVCLLPNAAQADAESVMTRIKAAATGCQFSFGVAELARGDDEVALLARADDRLYEAKAARPEGIGRKPVRSPLEDRLKSS